VVPVYDRRHRQHDPVPVTDDGIPRFVTDNPKVMPQMTVSRVEVHEFYCGEFPGLVQWPETNFRWDFGIVDKRRLNGVKVMCADSDQ